MAGASPILEAVGLTKSFGGVLAVNNVSFSVEPEAGIYSTHHRHHLPLEGRLVPKLGRQLILDEEAKGILPLLNLEGERKEVRP